MSTDRAAQLRDAGRLAGQADVAIVVDSACCLPPDLIRRWNITLVPHELIIDGRSYRDGVDISPGEFYKILRDSRVVHHRRPPAPGVS
jgi:fatty acid-binding protein DegV